MCLDPYKFTLPELNSLPRTKKHKLIDKWFEDVTKEDILKAIDIYNNSPKDPKRESRSTFLIHNKRKYPDKRIKELAFKVHYGTNIGNHFYGGDKAAKTLCVKGFYVINTFSSKVFHPSGRVTIENISKFLESL